MPPTRRFYRPAWVEVDLALLLENLRCFKARLRAGAPARGVPRLLFVVKANGYGHGAAACALAAERAGLADWLGVSSVEEGIALRSEGVRLPILILGSIYPFESFLAAAEFGLTPTVASLESARRLGEAAKRLRRAAACHLKIETGLNRIGVRPQEGVRVAQYLNAEKGVTLEGVYTHLACADTDPRFTRAQLSQFGDFLSHLGELGIRVSWRHAANSAGALRFPESRLDLVRPGIALYGLYPGFEPVLSLKTKVIFIKNVSRGTPLGYGATFRTRRASRIATIPMGYADGLSRGLSNKGHALVGGQRCKVVGKISMDMSLLDVTGVPSAKVGDDVVLIGRQGDLAITAVEIAKTLGTIPYEVVCAISGRVPRVYLGERR